MMPVIDIHEISNTHDWMYGINYKYSALCKISLITNEIKKFQSLIIDGEKLQYGYATEFYRHILATDTLVFVINTFTNKLLIFNVDLQLIQKIYLFEKKEYMSIIGTSKNKLFVYAINSGIILGIDLADWKVTEYQVPKKYIGKINTMEIKIIDDSFWLTGYMGNVLLEIFLENGKVKEHQINCINGDICLCEKFEDSLWLCTQYEIVEWNKQKNMTLQVFQLPIEKRTGSLMPFYYSRVIDDCLWLFPLKENKLLKIDKKRINIESVAVQKNIGQAKCQKSFGFLETASNTICGLDNNMNSIILNTDSGKIRKSNFLITATLLQEMKNNFYKYDFCMDEKFFSIPELLEESIKADSVKDSINIGYKIYNCC